MGKLFGENSRDIYNEEIRNNVFSWTDGTVDEVKNWLKVGKKRNNTESLSEDYILSSLTRAKRLLNGSKNFI